MKLRPALATLHWKKYLPTALMLVGLFLLGYVGTQYYAMYAAQKRLAKAWQQQNSTLHTSETAAVVDDGLIRVEIPKINLDAMVVEGSSRRQLKIAPGHITTTPIPGESGNSVITAHRDTFFRHIYELTKGDEIMVRRNGQVFKFQVIGKKVVDPDDVSVLTPTTDAHLTLITCYPTYYIGPAPERLVVSAKLVEHTAAVAGSTQHSAVGIQ